MDDKNLKLINVQKEMEQIIYNKTIMMHTTEYIETNRIKKQYFNEINYIQLHKKIIIPAELVGLRRRKEKILLVG